MVEFVLFKVVASRPLDHIFNVHFGRVNYLLRKLLWLPDGGNIDKVELHVTAHPGRVLLHRG